MDLTQWKQDAKKVSEGVVKKFDVEGKVYIRVARHNNPKFEKELRRLMEPYKNHRRGKIPEKVVEENTKKAMADFILIDMVGFTDGQGDITGKKGSVIENTAENRFKVLMHPDYAEFLELISGTAQDFDAFKVEQEDEQEGKSVPPSDGSGPGVAKKGS